MDSFRFSSPALNPVSSNSQQDPGQAGFDVDFAAQVGEASEMRRRLKPPLPLKEVLEKALEKWDLAKTFRRHEAADNWPELVGPKIAGKSRPKNLQGEVLVVEVDHPAWMQELNLLKTQILDKMHETHPRSGIKNLRFVLK